MLTIGRLATAARITPDALRYYEREGLLSPAGRTAGGYRLYDAEAAADVRFIRHAQECGFTLAEIRELLELRRTSSARCGDVRRRAVEKKLQLDARLRAMRTMSRALDRLIAECGDGEQAADRCPILAGLGRAGGGAGTAPDRARGKPNGPPRRAARRSS